MTTLGDDLNGQAGAAIEAMRAAALRARALHAEAELVRHMLTTTAKVRDRPKPEAVGIVVEEWMAAWYLSRRDWPHLARDMEAVTEAFYEVVREPGPATDAALRERWAALDAAFRREGTSLADQMAWRSQCAHGWWEAVSPVPADLPGRKPRPIVPRPVEGEPFWSAGCAELCR